MHVNKVSELFNRCVFLQTINVNDIIFNMFTYVEQVSIYSWMSWKFFIFRKLPANNQDFSEFREFPSKWKHCISLGGFQSNIYMSKLSYSAITQHYLAALPLSYSTLLHKDYNFHVEPASLFHWMQIYRVSHKKRNGGFSVACDLKVPYLFTSSYQATPAEENDTKIIKFDWVILILWPFVKTQSFSNFAWFLRPMSEGLCWEWPFIVVFWGSPLIRVNKRNTVQRDYPRHYNERLFPT